MFTITHSSDRMLVAETRDQTFILAITRRGSRKVRASAYRNAVRELDSPIALARVPIAIRRAAYARLRGEG